MAAAAPVASGAKTSEAQKAATPPTPAKGNPAAPATPAPKEKKEKEVLPVFDTADALLAEVAKRDRGPRRPYQVDFNSKSYFVMAGHMDHAMRQVMTKLGGTATEIGKAPRAPREVTVDSLMAAVNAMPEDKKAAFLKALEGLNAAKK